MANNVVVVTDSVVTVVSDTSERVVEVLSQRGLPGPPGPVGLTGATGPAGPTGANGIPGLIVSNTEPQIPTGTNALWLKSGEGPQGDQFALYLVTGD